MSGQLHLVGDPAADELLRSNPFALLLGMLLDQQIPMEVAFLGPQKLRDRLGAVTPEKIASMPVDDFVAVCSQTPAVHRFPGSMGKRIHALSETIVDEYDGDVTQLWTEDEPTGKQVLTRLKKLPGFGDQKARIFLSLLGKQCGVEPTGWREAAGAYGDAGSYLSIADVVDAESLAKVRESKKAAKAAAKAK